jgi:hypothetical protein
MTTPWLSFHLLLGSFWLRQTWQSFPNLPTHRTSSPVISSYSQRWNWSSSGEVLTALTRSRLNCRTWWRCWRKINSSSASDYGNPTGIVVSMQKGTALKRMEANRNFDKWLSCSRRILRTFGWHHVYCVESYINWYCYKSTRSILLQWK